MEAISVKNLCKQLISFAIQRCRLSGDPCRLSVITSRSTLSALLVTNISISDTGAGSCLKEFQDLKYGSNLFSAAGWDGVLSITTTSISDSELFHYNLNVKESAPCRRIIKLPSTSKNSSKFSGTEVSLSTTEDMGVLLADITSFLRKMQILKISNVAIELVAEVGDQHRLQRENVVLATELTSLPTLESSNLEKLTSEFEDYVRKHRNGSSEKCQSCFPSGDNLKVGNGQASTQKHKNDVLVVEVVIVISELSEPRDPSCLKAFEPRTEVLYCRDFSPCSVDQSALKALKCIQWKNYGLTLASIADDECSVLLEWDNLPPNTHIDIALHCYNKQVSVPPLRKKSQLERKLMQKSIILALDDLKEKYAGALLSAHALKIQSYAPDLAKSIAGLILSSNDPNFQDECLSLLGMELGNTEGDVVEKCIKDKIMSVIDMNDKKPPNLRCIKAAPFLFGDDHVQEPEYMLPDCEEGEEEDYALMDF